MMPTWLRLPSRPRFGAKIPRYKAGRRAASTRLLLETLEDRVVPAQLMVTSPLDPATLTAGTLRYAAHQANTDAANGISDTIMFDTTRMVSDTITLQQGPLEFGAGGGTTTIDGGRQVAISGNNTSLIFQVDPGAQVALTGLTLESGAGHVINAGADALINGTPCPVSSSAGGAISNSGTLAITRSTLTGNVAAGLYSYGGAIYNVGTLTVDSSTLSGNTASYAAGFGGGGAIYNKGTLTLIDSTLANNAVATVAPVTGLGTSATPGGGGGILNLGTLTVTDSTLAGNSAPAGGGIDNAATGQVLLQDTIVATDAAATAPDVSGAVSGSNNLVGVGAGLSGIANADAGSNRVGTSTAPLNPLLGPVGSYGGPVPTMPLLTGSSAIAHGAAIAGVTTDERGRPRPTSPDIGAFQSQALASLAISAPAAAIAGVAFPVTISARDQYGDPVTSYDGTATLASSDKQTVYLSAAEIKLINGTATVPITLATPNTVTLTATSKVTGTSAPIVVGPAVASFRVSAPAAATAGTSFTVTITAQDRFGNPVAGYNGPVSLTTSDGQPLPGLPASITLSNGSAQVAVTLDTADTNVTLIAAAGSVQGTSNSIAVSPAAAASFTVSAPSTAGVGEGFAMTLTAKDAYGNVVAGYSGPVTLTGSDGQSVAISPAAPAWSQGTAVVTATLSKPDPNPITLEATAGTVVGISGALAVESAASEAISNGLADLVSWAADQPLPLVGTATSIRDALQRGLVDPINAYLAKNTPTSPGFLTLLQNLTAQMGGLTVTVAPSSVQQAVNGSQVTLSLDFQATNTAAVSLQGLGAQADRLGIRLDPSMMFDVTTSLNFNFSFGVDQTPGLTPAQAFFLNAPAGGLSASVAINASGINGAIDIGFLGAATSNGSIQMNAQDSNANSLSAQTLDKLHNLALTPSGTLNVVLPLKATLGTQVATGTLTVSSTNLATDAPAVRFQGFTGWQNFVNIGPDEVMGKLNQLAGQLGQVGEKAWATELPFLPSLSLARATDLGRAFQAEVTSQISTWSAALQRNLVDFTTAQGLASLLAQMLDVSPAAIGVSFNPTTNALTYKLSLTDYTFSGLPSQSLQVDLNQGGLAHASLTSSQLSLVPKITASFTIGLDLTPLGRGFVLTPSTPLSTLNGGAGVRINGTSPDLKVTLTDGSSFQVSLAGAQTVQDVINDIQKASGGKVTVAIDSTSPQGLDVTQVSPAPGSGGGTSTFTIAAINGSDAAADLGIAGSDPAGTGTITGQSLSGDSLQDHVFIQNATVQASVVGKASQVNATADLGAVALQMVNGSGSLTAQASLTITGATTLGQLAQALQQGGASLSALVSPTVSGSAHLSLPLKLAVPLAGYTLPSGAMVAVNWTDITNPGTLSVAVTPALDLSKITMPSVLQGLQGVESFVQGAAASLLGQHLPAIGTSLISVIDPASLLSSAVSTLVHNAPTTIDQLASQLGALLGQPVAVSFTNNVLRITLQEKVSTAQDVNLGFNLSPSLGSIADVNGSAPLSLAAGASVTMGLAIDLSQPSSPQFYIQDSSKIAATALVNGSGIAFDATIGPLGLSISNGTARLDNGVAGQPATWTVGLATNTTNHLWPLSSAAGEITSAIKGQVNIVLPTFFPTPGQPLDPSTPNIELHVTDVSQPGSTTAVKVPSFASAMSSISLSGIMDEVVDGWDGLMRMLQSALTRQINVASVPVVGKQLQQALTFLQTMDQKVTALLENAPQLAAQTVQDAIYQALGPQGLNWLVNLVPGGAATEDNYVRLQQSSGSIHYYLKLHQDLLAVSDPVAVNLGLRGLGLSINGDASLNAGFDATLGFGVSQQYGFYVDSSDTAAVSFTAGLPTSATATLGFLQFNVTNNTPQTPPLAGGLSLGLNDVNGTGRLSLDDLASTSAYTVGLNADASLNLHLDATIGGDTNLPHLSTDFYFDWSTAPTASNPDALGFTGVTLDLGGFIDHIAAKIGQVLKPIEPLAKVLTAPLPVLSQLAGHNVDLVDLASVLGLCSPGTAGFIDAVAKFVDGGLNVPSSMDLGSFTLDPAAAEDPTELGALNPATTDIQAGYTGSPITGFQIPILSNPASAFQLLLGKDVPLVTYEMPQLSLDFTFEEFFPIIGPLGADLIGEIGAAAQFGFGFDTSGFRQYAASHFRDPSLILDGFYVSNRRNADGTGPVVPQVELFGSIAAYAALDLAVASAGVGGGIFASIGFSVHDPSGTGKVHLQDLEADVQKGTIFDASGALQAFLNAYVQINLGLVKHRWTLKIATVTLGQIGEPAPSTPPVPQLATAEPSGVLRLNIGPYASQRLYGNTADGNEALTVTQGPNAHSVYVSGFGVTNQEYDNVSEIASEGAAGGDTITIDAGSGIDVDLETGGGTNTVDVKSARNVTLIGGAGSDTLEVDNAANATIKGGSGTEVLEVTGGGAATLQAGSGRDALYAGSGAGQVLYGGAGTDLLVGGSGANQVLHGGSGTSILVGGSGAGQQLFGDSSTAAIFGGTGSGQMLTAGTGDDHLYAGEADGQVLYGGSGSDVLQAGWHLPDPEAAPSFGNLPVGATDPTTNGPLKVGWHLSETPTPTGWVMTNYIPGDKDQGAGHAYVMQAGTGNTLIIGGRGDDTIYGGSGVDTLYGGGGSGNKLMYAGVGATQMYGGGPGDNASPSTGTHILYGGSGRDVLYGGDGCNIKINPSGTGLVNAGGDGGDIGVNILAAGSGDSTLFSDSAGTRQNTLIAGSGLDKLFAGGGSGDYLEAGSGVDSLYGGTGEDVFQLPFIPAGQQAATPDTLVGGYGLTSLVLKPVETQVINGQLTQVSPNTYSADNDIYLTAVAGTTNQFLATLHDLDTGNLVGQVQFTLPSSVERIALMGGLGDNQIATDPSVQRGVLIYGGPGHNILIGSAGNDSLISGSGTSIIEGGIGNDSLYGGGIPAVYQNIINSLGVQSGGTTPSGATSNALMTWLRQQPAGHNILIAGSGNSELFAGNGGDLLIGGNAMFNSQSGQFVLQQGAGRDVLEGGQGNDLMIGGLGGAGDAMTAGGGNDVLIGGPGQDILEGGGGNDVLIGGGLLNIMMSNSASTASSVLLGGTGVNFEFAGAGNDQLFDYSNPSDPAQAGAWGTAQAMAATYHVVLPQPAPAQVVNPQQAVQNLLDAQSLLNAEVADLNAIANHPQRYGTIASGSNMITNLYFQEETGTTTHGSNVVTGLDTSSLVPGELVTGPGIPAGTTITSLSTGQVVLKNTVTSAGTNTVPLEFSDTMVSAATWETGKITSGSNTITGLAAPIAAAGYTTNGSNTITGIPSTASLRVGDTVTGSGIPANTTITQIIDNNSILLSNKATVTPTMTEPILLTISRHLTVGLPVTGPGIPAGTTIASVISGTSITLSSNATASITGTFCFGSLPFAGPLVSDQAGAIPGGDSVTSVISDTSVTLGQAATQTASNKRLTFSLTPEEEQQREALNNAMQQLAIEEVNALKSQGATSVMDFMQGGSGTDALYAGPSPARMIGGGSGSHTFYITPANYGSFAKGLDNIQGGSGANDTLMCLGDGDIHLGYNSTSSTDVATINGTPLSWAEGNNISTVGVQTMGGYDRVTIDSAKFGTWTSAIRVVDGGVPGTPGLEGDVVIDATALTERASLLGGAGNDTIKIDRLAFGSVVQGGTGHNQRNELDIVGDSNGGQVFEGPDSSRKEDLQTFGGTWVGATGFQRLVVIGGSASGTIIPTNQVVTDGKLIPVVVMEGGNGAGVQNQFTASGGTNTFIGGSGTNQFTASGGTNTFIGGSGTNQFTAFGGTNTLIGGSGANTMAATGGTNTFYGGAGTNAMTATGGTDMFFGGSGANTYTLNGAGTYTVYGGAGSNTIYASGGTSTITGGIGANQYHLAGAGTYTVHGGAGQNALYVQCAGSGDSVHLSQSGSTVSVSGAIGGAPISATASNMSSVEADGSSAGDNLLDASGMTMGVSLIGQGPGNTLQGGAGPDTLDGGSGGNDVLYAGNNDRLYVSGINSSYYGTGGNSLVYRAGPTDDVQVYGNGLLINGGLVYGSRTK